MFIGVTSAACQAANDGKKFGGSHSIRLNGRNERETGEFLYMEMQVSSNTKKLL